MRRIEGLACMLVEVGVWSGRFEVTLNLGEASDFSPTPTPTGFPLTRQITDPSDTLSPTFTKTDSTTPASDDGTSMLALSPSSVIKGVSIAIVSPALINTAITST